MPEEGKSLFKLGCICICICVCIFICICICIIKVKDVLHVHVQCAILNSAHADERVCNRQVLRARGGKASFQTGMYLYMYLCSYSYLYLYLYHKS